MSRESRQQISDILDSLENPAQSTIIDRWSRILFPATFTMFTFIYILVCKFKEYDFQNGDLNTVDCLI